MNKEGFILCRIGNPSIKFTKNRRFVTPVSLLALQYHSDFGHGCFVDLDFENLKSIMIIEKTGVTPD